MKGWIKTWGTSVFFALILAAIVVDVVQHGENTRQRKADAQKQFDQRCDRKGGLGYDFTDWRLCVKPGAVLEMEEQ